jgi:hypothetical protein
MEISKPFPTIEVPVMPEIHILPMSEDPPRAIEYESHIYELNTDFRAMIHSSLLRHGDILYYRHKEQ